MNLKVWASKLARPREERKEEVGAKSNIKKDLWKIMMNKNENDDVHLSVNER